jgi:hypothetical protein
MQNKRLKTFIFLGLALLCLTHLILMSHKSLPERFAIKWLRTYDELYLWTHFLGAWTLFAPTPISFQSYLEMRCKQSKDEEWSAWLNSSGFEMASHWKNLFSLTTRRRMEVEAYLMQNIVKLYQDKADRYCPGENICSRASNEVFESDEFNLTMRYALNVCQEAAGIANPEMAQVRIREHIYQRFFEPNSKTAYRDRNHFLVFPPVQLK